MGRRKKNIEASKLNDLHKLLVNEVHGKKRSTVKSFIEAHKLNINYKTLMIIYKNAYPTSKDSKKTINEKKKLENKNYYKKNSTEIKNKNRLNYAKKYKIKNFKLNKLKKNNKYNNLRNDREIYSKEYYILNKRLKEFFRDWNRFWYNINFTY